MVLRASTALIVFALSWRLTGGLLAGCLQWSQPLIQKTTLNKHVLSNWFGSSLLRPFSSLLCSCGLYYETVTTPLEFWLPGLGRVRYLKLNKIKQKIKIHQGLQVLSSSTLVSYNVIKYEAFLPFVFRSFLTPLGFCFVLFFCLAAPGGPFHDSVCLASICCIFYYIFSKLIRNFRDLLEAFFMSL